MLSLLSSEGSAVLLIIVHHIQYRMLSYFAPARKFPISSLVYSALL